MDWRGRCYYTVSFDRCSYDMRTEILKNISSVKLHSYRKVEKQPDEVEPRMYSYHWLIGCNHNDKEAVEYELRKAERNDYWCKWKEIKRDTSKKYFDIYGQQMPYRKCDINPRKRCNHCGDC